MTNARFFRQPARVAGLVLVLLASPMADRAAPQDRPGAAIDIAAGWVGFPDEGIVSEGLLGGAARWYLLPRVSVGPELVYVRGTNHNHLVATANITWDLRAPVNGRPAAITPFLVAGGGVFQTRERFFNGTFRSSEGAFTAGGGVRALVGDRVTVGLDLRAGWETHIRINGVVGVQLGR